MTSKLYAESAPRGFKAYQVEIPVAKVLNRIQQEGKQKVANIETVAKADKERSRAWLESKLHADKVTLDNIRENYRFSEKNKERIAKAEQKELDNRVRSAQIEYNQNARRPPDKSLLEKLGPALAKAIPQVVGMVQAHQAGIDKAAGEAAQEMMWKLDITSAEYNDMISHHNSLRGDTVAQEAYYESLIGKFTDKTGHVFTRDDFVRLLEDGTGAYSIAAQGVAAINGMSAYEQNMKMWELENKRKYNDPVMYQQAVEEQSIVARDAAFGKEYFNSKLSHYVKFTKIKPQFDKVTDGMLSRHHTFLDREAHFAHEVKQSSELTTLFAENNYAAIGPYMEGRITIRGGDRSVAFTETFNTLDKLAQTGQLDLQDVNALLRYGRDSSGNQALGTPNNSNLYSQRIDRLRTLVLNSSHQTNNVIERQQALGIKHFREQVQAQLAEEPSATAALKIRDHVMNTHEWGSMTQEQQNQFHQLWGPLLKHPKANTQTFAQRIGAPGANSLRKTLSKQLIESSFQDQHGLALKSLGSTPANLALVQSEVESILEQQFLKARDEGPSHWRDDTQGNLSDIFDKALQETQRIADASGLLKAVQDPDNPAEYIFNKYGKSPNYVSANSATRNATYLTNKDKTDKIFLGGAVERGRFNAIAAAYNTMINKGGEITRQDIMTEVGRMSYLRDMSRVTGIPVSELFANQLKVLHPNITIPDSAITTTEEIREAKEAINQTLLDLRNGNLGVSTGVGMQLQSNTYQNRTGLLPVGHTPGVTGRKNYNNGMSGDYGRFSAGKYSGRLKLTREDAEYIAIMIQGEAGTIKGKGFNGDDAMVTGVVINRMSDPRWYGANASAKRVVTAQGQFIGYRPGVAPDQRIVQWLLSQEGQSVIIDALHQLEGRTTFKGREMYHNMGKDDIRAHNRANFAHFQEQRHPSDPTLESYKRYHWRDYIIPDPRGFT